MIAYLSLVSLILAVRSIRGTGHHFANNIQSSVGLFFNSAKNCVKDEKDVVLLCFFIHFIPLKCEFIQMVLNIGVCVRARTHTYIRVQIDV